MDGRVCVLCQKLEAIFMHGLKRKPPTAVSSLASTLQLNTLMNLKQKSSLFKNPGNLLSQFFDDSTGATAAVASTAGSQSNNAHIIQDPNEISFWPFIKNFLSKYDADRFDSLAHIRTDTGRQRAWLRSCLNEHCLERYTVAALGNETLLRQYYDEQSFLLDKAYSAALPMLMSGLQSILFAVNIDNPNLNVTQKTPTPQQQQQESSLPMPIKNLFSSQPQSTPQPPPPAIVKPPSSSFTTGNSLSAILVEQQQQPQPVTTSPKSKKSTTAAKKKSNVTTLFDYENNTVAVAVVKKMTTKTSKVRIDTTADTPKEPEPPQQPTSPTTIAGKEFSILTNPIQFSPSTITTTTTVTATTTAKVEVERKAAASPVASPTATFEHEEDIIESIYDTKAASASAAAPPPKPGDSISATGYEDEEEEEDDDDEDEDDGPNSPPASVSPKSQNQRRRRSLAAPIVQKKSPLAKQDSVSESSSVIAATTARGGNSDESNDSGSLGPSSKIFASSCNLVPLSPTTIATRSSAATAAAAAAADSVSLSSYQSEASATGVNDSRSPQGGTKTLGSTESMSVKELREVVLVMIQRKEELEQANRRLEETLADQRLTAQGLGERLDECERDMHKQRESYEARLQSVENENKLLKEQLKKYVSAVQMIRNTTNTNNTSAAATGAEAAAAATTTEQPTMPPRNESLLRDYSYEAEQYEQKLIQVAEMHGELMEFNARLHRALNFKTLQVDKLKQELVELRGPLPHELSENHSDVDVLSQMSAADVETFSGAVSNAVLINVWIPSAFLHSDKTGSHHVYQIYVRIKDEEWNIYRRFSHFHAANSKLKEKFPIVSSVPFPKKKTLGNKDSKFVETRRKQLQDYLRQVVNIVSRLDQDLNSKPCKETLIKSIPFLSDSHFNFDPTSGHHQTAAASFSPVFNPQQVFGSAASSNVTSLAASRHTMSRPSVFGASLDHHHNHSYSPSRSNTVSNPVYTGL